MKTIALVLSALIASAAAAPAIVWTGDSKATVHSSDVTNVSEIVQSTIQNAKGSSSLESVIFVVNRDLEGSDGLTTLTSSGALPTIGSKYDSAHSIHHYVRGIENTASVARNSRAGSSRSVVETTLHEFKAQMDTEFSAEEEEAAIRADGSVAPANRARALATAEIMVVHIQNKAKSTDIDSIVSAAIENPKVGSVILTAVRSQEEVMLERNLEAKARHVAHAQPRRRRMEDAQEEGEQDGEDGDNDTDGVYFVNYTPNIFAGVMFFFFFTFITYTGLGCMNMIAGQDVYVEKYPSIGREA